MKFFTEVRELENENIKDIYYFDFEGDADKYIEECPNECIKKQNYIISKGRSIETFKQEKLKLVALSKLTDEEKETLGL